MKGTANAESFTTRLWLRRRDPIPINTQQTTKFRVTVPVNSKLRRKFKIKFSSRLINNKHDYTEVNDVINIVKF